MSIENYHNDLKSLLITYFSARIPTIQCYLNNQQKQAFRQENDLHKRGLFTTPALIIELTALDILPKGIGDGRTAFNLNIDIHCILGWTTRNIELQLRILAAEVMHVIKNQSCQIKHTSSAENITALPGRIKQGEYDSQVVSFNQPLLMGLTTWKGDSVNKKALGFDSLPQKTI